MCSIAPDLTFFLGSNQGVSFAQQALYQLSPLSRLIISQETLNLRVCARVRVRVCVCVCECAFNFSFGAVLAFSRKVLSDFPTGFFSDTQIFCAVLNTKCEDFPGSC